MATIGRKIYYETTTGFIIAETSEREGDVIETTFEQDKTSYPLLKLYDDKNIGFKQLEFGELKTEFQTCIARKIDPITKELIFLFA